MKASRVMKLMTYAWMAGEWKWLLTAVVVGSGLFMLWLGYKIVFFRLTWRIGKTDVEQDEKEEWNVDEELVVPFSGRLIPITQVPDLVFSEKIIGDGFAIELLQGEILSPVNGKVTQIYSNGNAVTLISRGQRNIILHIGIDTSDLKGRGIFFEVKEGEEVRAGQNLGRVDLGYVIPRVTSVISPIIFLDLKESERVVLRKSGMVKAGERGIIAIEKKHEYEKKI